MPKRPFAASAAAMALGGAFALVGSALTGNALAQNALAQNALAQNALAAEQPGTPQSLQKESPGVTAPATPEARKDTAGAGSKAKAKSKPKRRDGVVFAQPSLAMDPDPFLALSSPAVGLVYNIPRRQ